LYASTSKYIFNRKHFPENIYILTKKILNPKKHTLKKKKKKKRERKRKSDGIEEIN
jgi:hypothetical protein